MNGAVEHCALCENGKYLDLSTYTCVTTCPSMSMAIATKNIYSFEGEEIKYCRPFINSTSYKYAYYVDPSSTSHIELGTYEYPFKNMDPPAKEIFNFMYETETDVTVYHKRGTSMKLYYGIQPIILLNLKNYTLTTYGNSSEAKPYVYITDHEYQWPDSTLFSLAEIYYNTTLRVERGDMQEAEAAEQFLKFFIYRSSLHFQEIDFQSIMFGDAWSNPLVFSFESTNHTVIFDDCYLDVDGCLCEGYYPISIIIKNSHVNVSHYEYGVWYDFRWDCVANNAENVVAFMIIENNLFTDKHIEALYNWVYFASVGDFIFRNNTLDALTFIDLDISPFLEVRPQTDCDPSFRTQKVLIDENKFLNLVDSNLMFFAKYMSDFQGQRVFSFQNNYFKDSEIDHVIYTIDVQNPTELTISNNYYDNISVLKTKHIVDFYGDTSNVTITNETVVNSVLDDLHTIDTVEYLTIKDFTIDNITNTGTITEVSALLKLTKINKFASIENFQVTDSTFMYGKAIQIDYALELELKDSQFEKNHLQSQDLLYLDSILQCSIRNLTFTSMTKQSDSSRFVISLPTLITSDTYDSVYEISDISISNSSTAFLTVQQVSGLATDQGKGIEFKVKDCSITDNTLPSKDTIIELGEISYSNLTVTFENMTFENNSLELGNIFSLKSNCKEIKVMNSQVNMNQGRFAALEPASTDTSNPLIFYIENTQFKQNYAKEDGLIQMTTNSIMHVSDSDFEENYSIGRGSVLFAEYQAVSAYFTNCLFSKNYAYEGGVFYVQYSSTVEVSNSSLTDNFAVIGGVAYVNNDGAIKINSGSKVFNNSALNTCFLYLINTQQESSIDGIEISQNDQNDPVISKSEFLQINDTYKHLQKTYFTSLDEMSSKIKKTIVEKVDSALLAIKAKVKLMNTKIYNNDMFLSASTESKVSITNSSISDLSAHGKMIQTVSSSIILDTVQISNIAISGDTNYYLLTLSQKSTFQASSIGISNITGLLLYASASHITIDNGSQVSDITNQDRESSMISIDSSIIVINDINFDQLHQYYYSPIINLEENAVVITGASFTNFDKTLIYCNGGIYAFSNVVIQGGQMTYQPGEREFMVNSIVFDISNANLALDNVTVNGIATNFSSPVIYMENDVSTQSKATLTISNSAFAGNEAAVKAGVIHAINTDLNIEKTSFVDNHALGGDAGVLYLECEDSYTLGCNYTIKNSVFINNSAQVNGGAIKFTYYKPDVTVNNTFSGNTAQYGNDLASYPVQMEIGSQRRRLAILNQTETQKLNITDGIVFEISDPLVSGSLIPDPIYLTLKDEDSRLLITDNSSVAVMNSVSSTVQVLKSKSVKAVKGVFTFDDVIIIGPPGNSILLKINTDNINCNKISKVFPNIQQQQIYIKAFLRLCDVGEYQTSDNKCVVCSSGFYTLLPNQTSCNECPSHTTCSDGYKITVSSGYWRNSTESIRIFECYNTDACLGGYEIQCQTGYGGNLCQSCVKVQDTWYTRESSNECSECIDKTQNSWRLAGVSILIFVYFIILIWTNIKADGEQKVTTVCMRILTNYFQILMLAQSFDLSWDDNIKEFLNGLSFIAKTSDIILSIDCFIRDNGVQTHPVFIKMIITCMIPLICITIMFFFWVTVKFFRPQSDASTNMITSIIISVFCFLPTITSITFSIFNCVEIFNDGDMYLAVDLDIKCWEGEHAHYANSFGIPIMVIWVLSAPLLALFILFKKRKLLMEKDVLKRYGFLYTGLRPSAFYLEILLHFRKVLLISINVFFTNFKSLYRAMIGFIVMLAYIEFLHKVHPYTTYELNQLEIQANIAAFATFYGGLFLIQDNMSMTVTAVIFTVILLINLVFWIYWIKITFRQFYARLRTCLSCLRPRAQKGDFQFDEKVENLDQEDGETSMVKDGKRSHKGSRQHSYQQAPNDSVRNVSESMINQEPSVLFIIANQPKKDKKSKTISSKKHHKKKAKTKVVSESKEEIGSFEESAQQMSAVKQAKTKNHKKTKEILVDGTGSDGPQQYEITKVSKDLKNLKTRKLGIPKKLTQTQEEQIRRKQITSALIKESSGDDYRILNNSQSQDLTVGEVNNDMHESKRKIKRKTKTQHVVENLNTYVKNAWDDKPRNNHTPSILMISSQSSSQESLPVVRDFHTVKNQSVRKKPKLVSKQKLEDSDLQSDQETRERQQSISKHDLGMSINTRLNEHSSKDYQ